MINTYNTLIEKENNFNCVTVDTMEQLQNEIAKYDGKEEYIFRGANEAKFMMYTSAQRILSHPDQTSFFLDVNHRIQRVWNSSDIMNYFAHNGIPVNDILILGLLQHFQSPSTLLDFTHDINTALFFATDGLKMPNEEHEEIDEYFSVYIIDRRNPFFCSLQQVMNQGALSIEHMVEDSKMQIHKNQATKVLEEFEKLYYYQFEPWTYVLILGEEGKITIRIPIFDFSCTYYITNPNLRSQYGLFILNNTYNQPLEVLIKEFARSTRPLVNCINIHKSLKQDIIDNYQTPNGICKETIYPQNEDTIRIKQWLTNIGLIIPTS